MSGNRRRETIHISLGGTANAVTSHLLNLEGLASTYTNNNDNPVCDPVVTHTIDPTDEVWVPRVLFIDEAHRIQRASARHQASVSSNENAPSTMQPRPSELASSVWAGNVQEFSVGQFNLNDYTNVDNVVANVSFNSNFQPAKQHANATQAQWLSSWQQAASELAYAPYSQYRVSEEQQQRYQYLIGQPQGSSEEQYSRHVNWDELAEEPDEDEEEAATRLERQRRQQLQQWESERQQWETQLSGIWKARNSSQDQRRNETEPPEYSQSTLQESDLQDLSWFEYWMPPYPSSLNQHTYGLPSTSAASSFQSPQLHSYNVSNHTAMLEDIWEKLRIQLERTDACQGFTFMTEGSGLYAGMTHWLLQELQQECRAAGRWVFQIADKEEDIDDDENETSSQNEMDQESGPPSRSTELARAQANVRGQVQRGLALAGLSDQANALIPLVLPSSKGKSTFRASAELAMALETATLPHRCQTSQKTLIGWNSMSGYEEGTPPRGMSLGDFLSTLQPSPRYSLLELDSVMTASNRQRLVKVLSAGTSVELDPRMRQPSRSAGMEHPGAWLLDAEHGSGSAAPSSGILTSMSPCHVPQQDRSLHHHFGISCCLRRGLFTQDSILTNNQQYLTCLMEGMGIRYRPETSFGLVTSQSLTQMTTMGYQYGAGSYWRYLLGDTAKNPLGFVDVPVLSVLGNTTRMYPYLHSTANDMKSALKSSKSKGFYQREVFNDTLPEAEDCDEALEFCWDLRDTYEPPHGSGLADVDEETYFDL